MSSPQKLLKTKIITHRAKIHVVTTYHTYSTCLHEVKINQSMYSINYKELYIKEVDHITIDLSLQNI